jgi:hypothetical protein
MDYGFAFLSAVDIHKDVALAERKGFTHAWLYDTQMIDARRGRTMKKINDSDPAPTISDRTRRRRSIAAPYMRAFAARLHARGLADPEPGNPTNIQLAHRSDR